MNTVVRSVGVGANDLYLQYDNFSLISLSVFAVRPREMGSDKELTRKEKRQKKKPLAFFFGAYEMIHSSHLLRQTTCKWEFCL